MIGSMNETSARYRVRGAGAFQGGVYASWPLAVLSVTGAGIEFSIEPPWLSRVAATIAFGGRTRVSVPAREVQTAVAGRTRLVLRSSAGDLWFQTLSRAQLDRVVDAARSSGIEIQVSARKPRMYDLETFGGRP